MELTAIRVGGVYNDRARRLFREVRAIEPAPGGSLRDAAVTYHVINVNYTWERYALTASRNRLAPRPTVAEFASCERVTRGIPVATVKLGYFARWARESTAHPPKYKERGRTMANLCLDRVVHKGYRDRSFINAVRFDSRKEEQWFTTEEFEFCWTFEDGSRIAFAQPGMYCEVDRHGRPLREGPHCLDFSQRYSPETTGPLVFADYKRWLPHLVPQKKYTPDLLPELLPCTHFIRQSVLFNPPAPSRRR